MDLAQTPALDRPTALVELALRQSRTARRALDAARTQPPVSKSRTLSGLDRMMQPQRELFEDRVPDDLRHLAMRLDGWAEDGTTRYHEHLGDHGDSDDACLRVHRTSAAQALADGATEILRLAQAIEAAIDAGDAVLLSVTAIDR